MRVPDLGFLIAIALAAWAASSSADEPALRDAGAIEGRVTYEGAPPPPIPVPEGSGVQPVLRVDRTGGLEHAVVFLPDARPGRPPAAPPAVVDQRDFVFHPQVLAVHAQAAVRFTNSDVANHNVRSAHASGTNAFSLNMSPGSPPPEARTFAVTPPDRPIVLSCDIHPWMRAWVYVFDHSQFAVTDPSGRFRLRNVPAGRHRFAVRQPAGRLARDLAVDVTADATAHVDVRFTPGDLGTPVR
jgi:plastocyanin